MNQTFDFDIVPIGVDSCTSATVSGIVQLFIGQIEPVKDMYLNGVGGRIPIVGRGTLQLVFTDDNGDTTTQRIEGAYYAPRLKLTLLSPKQWSEQGSRTRQGRLKRSFYLDGDNVQLTFEHGANKLRTKTIEHDENTNIPLLMTKPGNKSFTAHLTSLHLTAHEARIRPNALNTSQIRLPMGSVLRREAAAILQAQSEDKQDHPDPFDLRGTVAPSLSTTTAASFADNEPNIEDLHFDDLWTGEWDDTAVEADLPKLDAADKKTLMLRWHYRLGHMPFRDIKASAKAGLLDPRLATIPELPFCPGCQFGKAHKRQWRHRSPKKNGQQKKPPQALHPGAAVSVDTMESTSVPGLIPQLRGTPTLRRYHYATVFVDHFSDLSYVHLHERNDTDSILEAKLAFERYSGSFGVLIRHYRSDNGLFADNGFRAACRAAHQTQSFCGSNAHHQNGRAEKCIRDLRDSARSMLLLAKHNWPAAITAHLWGFAMIYAAEIRNSLVREGDRRNKIDTSGKPATPKTPLQRFANTTEQPNTKVFHTFGCPVYNLDPNLQGGNSLKHKWCERARIGIFLGLSRDHATSISIVLNPITGLTTPQFHVKHDEHFETVNIKAMHNIGEWQGKTRIHEKKEVRQPKGGRARKRTRFAKETGSSANTTPQGEQTAPQAPQQREGMAPQAPQQRESAAPRAPHQRESATSQAPQNEGSTTLQASHQRERVSRAPQQRERGQRTQTPKQKGKQQSTPAPNQRKEENASVETGPAHQLHSLLTHKSLSQRKKRGRDEFEDSATASSLEERSQELRLQLHSYRTAIARRVHAEELANECMTKDIMGLAATLADEDTMYLHQAKQEPDWPEFHEAMVREIHDHTKGKHWIIVPRSSMPKGHKAMRGVWSMKRKRRVGTGEIYKWKARLCIDGSSQQKGINYWETYSPVVAWETICSLLTLAIMYGWEMHQVDFVLAFPQAEVECDMYMEIPRECYVDGTEFNEDNVLLLKKNLYGAKQAGKVWFDFLKKGLMDIGFERSKTDKAVFFKGETIFVVYVDDGILMGPNSEEIESILKKLGKNYKMTDEGNLNEYLGIQMEDRGDRRILKQPALIKRILATVGMDDPNNRPRRRKTPAREGVRLHKDIGGNKRKAKWDYRSVVGMLNWLSRSTRPDILFAVSQVGRFMAFPKESHETAIIRICEYLYWTSDKGMVMRPEEGKGFEVYADADFAGNYHKGSLDDPATAKSRTAYHIMFNNCLIYSHSKMQTEIALSTTEAEYICLLQSLRTATVLMRFFKELAQKVKCFKYTKPRFKCTAFEDNQGAIEIANAENQRPRTKHINIKYHHFKQAVKRGKIKVRKIDTKDQLADIGTKALGAATFEKLRKLLMGW